MRISDWSSDVCSSDLVKYRSTCPFPAGKDLSAAGASVRVYQVLSYPCVALYNYSYRCGYWRAGEVYLVANKVGRNATTDPSPSRPGRSVQFQPGLERQLSQGFLVVFRASTSEPTKANRSAGRHGSARIR